MTFLQFLTTTRAVLFKRKILFPVITKASKFWPKLKKSESWCKLAGGKLLSVPGWGEKRHPTNSHSKNPTHIASLKPAAIQHRNKRRYCPYCQSTTC